MIEYKWQHAKQMVFLEITTWKGISLGAVHYYGTLRVTCECRTMPCSHLKKVDLERTLTISQAKELTKIQNDNSLFNAAYRYREGDKTKSFDDKESIKKMAIEIYKTLFPGKTSLVVGSPVYGEYDEFLDGEAV